MVFYDISQSEDFSSNNKNTAANLMDRFFSLLLDYLVISPFVLFLIYLSIGGEWGYWKKNPDAPESEIYIVLTVLTYIIFFSLIQSLFISKWRATPGQFFLKIRNEFHDHSSLIFFRIFLRQSSFWLSFVFFGLPFLSMLTNKSRRTFYDRIADVSIITLKKNEHELGFETEFKYWRAFTATVMLFFGFLMVSIIWGEYGRIVNRVASFYNAKANKYFCEELDDVSYKNRLLTAIALNLTNHLSDECLDREANFVLWHQKKADFSLAYYAKSLTTSDPIKEKQYLEESCAGQEINNFQNLTFGCKVANSFLNQKIEFLYTNLDQKNILNDVLKYELSLVLNKNKEIDSNFEQIDKYTSIKLVKKYRAIEMISRKYRSKNDRLPASVDETAYMSEDDEKIVQLIGDL